MLKVDWISSRQANDELLQMNCYLCELDFGLQLSVERKKTSQYVTSAFALGQFLLSHVNCLQVSSVQHPCEDKKGNKITGEAI